MDLLRPPVHIFELMPPLGLYFYSSIHTMWENLSEMNIFFRKIFQLEIISQ